MGAEISLEAQIKCVEREIALRKNFYSKRVKEGKLDPAVARQEYDAMKAVLVTLCGVGQLAAIANA